MQYSLFKVKIVETFWYLDTIVLWSWPITLKSHEMWSKGMYTKSEDQKCIVKLRISANIQLVKHSSPTPQISWNDDTSQLQSNLNSAFS